MKTRTAARSQLPENWQPSAEDMEAGCKALLGSGLTIEAELEKFRDYHLAHGSLMASWSRAFRYWMRRAPEFAPRNAPRPGNGAGNGQAKPWKERKAELHAQWDAEDRARDQAREEARQRRERH